MARTEIGDVAPDFELSGTGERDYRLADYRGRWVVLAFYPGDFTPVCTRQFCSYGRRADEVADLGATLVGISSQDLDSHEEFVARHGLTVPLLADEGGEIAKLYGAWRPVIGTRRAVFVVDEEGVWSLREAAAHRTAARALPRSSTSL